MEQQHDDTLMKARSYRSVIRTGLQLYTGSFRRIFKATWLLTTIYAMVTAVTGILITLQLTPVALQLAALPMLREAIVRQHWTLLLSVALLTLLTFVVHLLIAGVTGSKLEEHRAEGRIAMPARWLSVPTRSPLGALRRMCRAALRHWLLTLGILVVGNVVLLPLSFVTSLPAQVLATANMTAQAGTLMGDELGLPASMAWLTAGTWALAGFLYVYLSLSLLFVGYYAYGSAETRKQERKQQEQKLQS